MVDELELSEERDESTADLVREAISEARELTKLEVALAKDEAITELKELKASAIAFGVSGVTALLGVACVIMAIALATQSWSFPLIVGILFLIVAGGGALFGAKHLPRKPLDVTRHRLESDVQHLKERVA